MSDYENMSRQDLMKLRGDIDKAIANVSDRDKRSALKAAEAAARGHGYSLSELTALMAPKGRGPKTGAPARYRNPENPEQTWSGRGRRPRWFNEAEASGRPIAEMDAKGA